MFKYSGIPLNDTCIYDVSSTSIASQGFRHFVTEVIRNFANIISTGID